MNTYTHAYQGAELKPYERVFRCTFGEVGVVVPQNLTFSPLNHIS